MAGCCCSHTCTEQLFLLILESSVLHLRGKNTLQKVFLYKHTVHRTLFAINGTCSDFILLLATCFQIFIVDRKKIKTTEMMHMLSGTAVTSVFLKGLYRATNMNIILEQVSVDLRFISQQKKL